MAMYVRAGAGCGRWDPIYRGGSGAGGEPSASSGQSRGEPRAGGRGSRALPAGSAGATAAQGTQQATAASPQPGRPPGPRRQRHQPSEPEPGALMAAAKAEMQLLPPLQMSDPFGAFPHSPPAMDTHYPKLEEMMLLGGGGPQFLAPPGAPESAGFGAAGEPGEQHFEHLAAGKRAGLARGGGESRSAAGAAAPAGAPRCGGGGPVPAAARGDSPVCVSGSGLAAAGDLPAALQYVTLNY